MTEQPPTPHNDVDEFEDFDAWREQQDQQRDGAGKRSRIFGRVVSLPTRMPLGLQIRMDELKDSSSLDDLKKVVGALYGPDALDHWIDQGADDHDLKILMAYGVAHANRKPITLDRAQELVAEAEAKAAEEAKQGKGQGKKAPKRKTSGGRSGGAGR